MFMKKNDQRKSVAPIYSFGIVFLLYSILFDLSGFSGFIKCVLLAWAVSSLVKNIGKKHAKKDAEKVKETKTVPTTEKPAAAPEVNVEKMQTTGNPELDAVIKQGKESVKRLQEINDEIPDFKISAQLKQIEILTASVVEQVEKKEDKLKQVRQFMNYYLPTTIKLLEQYVQMQNVGMKGENITTAMSKIEEMLDKVIVAFQKQLDSLFERDVVDITADIQVMEQMMAAEGLTDERDF